MPMTRSRRHRVLVLALAVAAVALLVISAVLSSTADPSGDVVTSIVPWVAHSFAVAPGALW